MKKLFIILCLWSFVYKIDTLAQYQSFSTEIAHQGSSADLADFDHTQQIQAKYVIPELTITEVEKYKGYSFQWPDLDDSEYPFGRGLELTCSPSLALEVDLSDYGLAFFHKNCMATQDGAVKVVNLGSYGNSGFLPTGHSVWIDFEGPLFNDLKSSLDQDCGINDENPDSNNNDFNQYENFQIALFKNEGGNDKLINFINLGNGKLQGHDYCEDIPLLNSVVTYLEPISRDKQECYISVPIKSNGNCSTTQDLYGIYGDSGPGQTETVQMLGGAEKWGWDDGPNLIATIGSKDGTPYTDGVQLYNLQGFYTLAAPIGNGELLTRPAPMVWGPQSLCSNSSQPFGFNKTIPFDQIILYKNDQFANWSAPSNYFDWEVYSSFQDSDVDNIFQKVLTAHWGSKASIDFFENHLDITVPSTVLHEQFMTRVHPYGYWGSSHASSEFGIQLQGFPTGNDEVQLNVIAHEIGHVLNTYLGMDDFENPADLGVTGLKYDSGNLHEAFADIWGAAAENNILGVSDYIVGNRNGKKHVDFASPYIWSIGDSHYKALYAFHWYYLLSEGPDLVNELEDSPASVLDEVVNGQVEIDVCGLGEEIALKIFREHFNQIEYDVYQDLDNDGEYETPQLDIMDPNENPYFDSSLDQSQNFRKRKAYQTREFTLDAVESIYDYLEADPNNLQYTMFGSESENKEFIIAQVKNAWGEVNVGNPDFNVTTNSDLYVCTEDDIVLAATSEAAAQVLDLPDGTQVPAATFTWLKDGIEITDNTVIATVVENGIATSTLSETSTEADENVIYTVQINYHNDSGGCSLSKDIEVEVGFLFPHINDEFESVSFCEDDPNFNIELILHEIDQSSIEWYFTPFPVESNTPQSLNNDGNLQLTVDPSIYTATGGGEFSIVAYCNYTNDNVTGTIEVNINSSTPSVSFPYTSSVDFCLNTPTTIDITGSDDYEYVWSYDGPEGDLDITNEFTGEVIFHLPGTYDFSVFVSNGTCDPLEFIHTVTVMDFTPASEINENLVNSDVVINTNMKIEGTVIVPSGRLLTIQYCQIGFANSLSGIEVMPGGILLIEGAELTESACNTDGFWKGIQVKSNHPGLYLFGSGDPYGQYASYGPGSIPPFSDLDNRGMVISRAAVVVDCCYHNTVIRNARIGILDDNTNDSAFKGKGILRIERTDFINNKIGISWGRAPIGNTNSIVENCNFINHYGSNEIYSSESDGLPIIIDGEAFLDNTIMIQIKILETFVSNIRNNNFRYEAANLGDDDEKYDEKVIGISSSDSQLVVGEFDTDGDGSTSQNNFENLYRAIDVYRLSNTIITDIVNNHFENNLTGITLTNIPMAHIASNEIIVPAGSNDAKTYGLFAQACTDYEIIENNLDFNGSANPDTYGMIINNSNSGGDNKNSYVNNNRFTGPFEIGTQLENNNTGLQIRCNGYYDNVKVDLAVTEVLGNGDVLDQQGEYNPTTSSPEKNLFSTFWHTNPTTDELHIFNETDNNLEFIEDANSLTNEIDGTDIVSFTGQPNGVPANLENPCYNSLEPGIPGVPGGGVIGNAGPPDQKCKIGYDCPIDINDCSTISGLTIRELSGIVKDLVRDKHKLVTQEGSSITMSIGRVLDCHNSVWAGKFKVGNYVSVGDYTNGRAALEELPQETEIDQAFYTLYDAYITIKETEEGSGKYYGPLQTIKDIASTENNNGPGQSLAQAMLANLLEYTYIRKPMPLKRDKSESTISEQACFYIVPNPVSGEFSLDFISQESKEQNWKVWELYNLQGQLIKLGNYNEENSLNVNRINNGVYFLKLIDATGLSCSNRLIIQH